MIQRVIDTAVYAQIETVTLKEGVSLLCVLPERSRVLPTPYTPIGAFRVRCERRTDISKELLTETIIILVLPQWLK